eukprot:8835605-Lingulodinium_polyedra.AAC.1
MQSLINGHDAAVRVRGHEYPRAGKCQEQKRECDACVRLRRPWGPVSTTRRAPLETSTATAEMRGGRVPRMTCPCEA